MDPFQIYKATEQELIEFLRSTIDGVPAHIAQTLGGVKHAIFHYQKRIGCPLTCMCGDKIKAALVDFKSNFNLK